MRLLLLALPACLFLVACGSDDRPDFAAAAPEAAEAAVIKEDDLSPAWREGQGGTLERAELTNKCDVLTPDGAFPDAAATASSASFITTDQRSVQSFSAVYESEDQAVDAVSELESVVERCREEFLDEVRRLAEEELEATGLDLGPFADIDVAIERAPLDEPSDQALMYQVKVKVNVFGTEREFNADIALMRHGQVIGVLVYSAYAPTQSVEERAFLALVLERLTEASAKL